MECFKFKLTILIILLINILSLNIFATSLVSNINTTQKVYDYADLFTVAEEQKLYSSINEYIEETNYDMVIVTIDDNPKNNAMNYADDFYDYNGFGLDSENSGILFLIDMDTREMWISTTGKCISAYNDNEINSILDYAYNEISDEDYYGCANAFITKTNSYKSITSNSNTYPNINTSQKLYDYADLFTDSNEKTIYNRIVSSISENNIDIIIVTTNDNTSSSSDEYAKEFYLDNNFGFSTNKNGLLYLIDCYNNETVIYANGTTENVFTEEICNKIISETNDYYLDNEYITSAFYFLNNITLYSSKLNNQSSDYSTNFDTTQKVYDYADLFTVAEEQKLYSSINEYIEETNYDMVIVTIDDNPKNNAMNYADDFYDYNGFGLDSEYSGILFLIDMDTREMWISTTGKCIRAYNDNEIDSILDYTYDKIYDKDYYGCANTFISKANSYKSISSSSNSSNSDLEFAPILLITVIATGIFVAITTSLHKTAKKATRADAYSRNLNITSRNDYFIRKHTSKTYNPPSSSSSSGGSSTHRSSSGRSHGGGGRRF